MTQSAITNRSRLTAWVRAAATVILACLAMASPLQARPHRSEAWAHQQFARAERMREALNGRPAEQRARREYDHVIEAYRMVYFGRPTSTKADASVVAQAETLVEKGRQFEDVAALDSAIERYEFLRGEYPGSRYRYDALFTIAEVYKDDLNDSAKARATFQQYLKKYPHQRLAEEAKQQIAEMDRVMRAERKGKKGDLTARTSPDSKSSKAAKQDSNANADAAPAGGAGANSAIARSNPAAKKHGDVGATQGVPNPEAVAIAPSQSYTTEVSARSLPRVTGIRHWSTPDYTRVAVDLESSVRYDSQRIANPDRIVIDLKESQLASTLVGKDFDEADGFLRKMRIGQFQPGKTRLVLEVDSLADYSAFLLPNPYRLIIDIHGREARPGNLMARQDGKPAAGQPGKTLATVSAGTKTVDKSDADGDSGDSSNAVEDEDKPIVAAARKADAPAATRTSVSSGVPKTIVEADGAERTEAASAKPPLASSKTKKQAHSPARSDAAVEAKAQSGNDANVMASNDAVAATNLPSAEAPALSKAATRRGKSAKVSAPEVETASEPPAVREAQPTATGDRSLIRALGLKIGKIVIDAGHGGHDTGTIGPDGLREKDLVLDVALRLGKALESRLGAEVVYTRDDDTFIPLETRTAIANRERADLFISVHANSSDDETARGVETYYLNFTSSKDALEVAARENAVSEKSIHELQDLVKKIALKEKIEESREFAADVEHSLWAGLNAKNPGLRDRGVKKAPFVVLIGANMPSILAEISFVSNPSDEKKLRTGEYRQHIADSLYKGVAKYVSGLGGVKVASLNKHEGE